MMRGSWQKCCAQSGRIARFGLVAAAAGLTSAPKTAEATLSIIAVDTNTGEIAAAAVSCVGTDFDLREVIAIDPAVGGVMAQSYYFESGKEEALSALQEGLSPESAIARATDDRLDPPGVESGSSYRQYAAINLKGDAQAFTGDDCLAFANGYSGRVENFTFSVQGNILTGQEVLDELAQGFQNESSALPARIAAALEAVAQSEGGDSRCSPLTADAGSFIYHPTNSPPIELNTNDREQDAAESLAAQIRSSISGSAGLADEDSSPQGSMSSSSGTCAVRPASPSPEPICALWLLAWGALARRRLRFWWGKTSRAALGSD